MRFGKFQRAAGRWLAAMGIVCGLFLLRLGLQPLLRDTSPYILFTFGILMVAAWQGLRGGLWATLASAAAGSYFLEKSFFPQTPEDQFSLIFFLAVGICISAFAERMRQTAAIAHEREQEVLRLAELIELSHDAIIVRDADDRIVRWNAGAVEVYGWSAAEAIGQNVHVLLKTQFSSSHQEIRDELHERAQWQGELLHEDRQGGSLVVESRWALSRDKFGNVQAVIEINRDITSRRRSELELRASEERLRMAQSAGAIGSYDWDIERNRAVCSPEYFQLFGLENRNDPISCEEWLDMIHPEDRRRVAGELDSALTGKQPFDTQYRVVWPDGSIHWLIGKGRVHFNAAGQPVRMTGITFDLTRTKRAEEEIKRLYESAQAEIVRREMAENELRRSNEDLLQFAYIISHDLQEPLRTAGNFSEILAKRYGEALDGEAREFLDYVIGSVSRMRRLIEDLLEYSRVAHESPAEFTPVDMKLAWKWAVNNLESALEESKAQVTEAPLPSVPGDFLRLGQLLQNLLSNALKYRGKETPQVHISAEAGDGAWIFSVSDNGIGVAEPHQERIFGVFKRLHGRDLPGTGIGLAICKKIVERHGGRIWVESEPGKGSAFRFSLPASKEEENLYTESA